MDFIDLFAGLGGFHLALRKLGHQCVFACEIDTELRLLYKRNYEQEPKGDIRELDIHNEIPSHDILCAGFPCQPFSVAGQRKGMADRDRGERLFNCILDILREKKPRYFILENVPHLKGHNGGQTWLKIENDLRSVGYQVVERRYSPHQFGIPQVRWRMFIVGSRSGFPCLPEPPDNAKSDIRKILDTNPPAAKKLSEQETTCLDAWQNFLKLFPKDVKLPSVPIWSREFGATYPFKEKTPYALGVDKLREYRGNYGAPLNNLDHTEVWQNLPAYAKREQDKFPQWKIQYLDQNRKFYKNYARQIDEWIPQILNFPRTCQRLEWNFKGEGRNIWDLIIQFRGSGVRVRSPKTAPTLTARCADVPIIGWEKRYMTPSECARLQSLDEITLPEPDSRAFKAVGNAVNAAIVTCVADALIATRTPSPQLFFPVTLTNTSTEIKVPLVSSDTRIEKHAQIRKG